MLSGDLAHAALADHGYFDLAGVFEVGLYLFGDVVGELGGYAVVYLRGLDHNADLAAGLYSVGLVHAPVTQGYVLQGAQAFDVGLRGLAPGAGAGRRDRVRGGDQHVFHGLHLHLVVVGADGADHVVGLAALLREAAPDQGVGALDLVVYGLAHVVEQGGAARDLHVGAEFLGHHAAEVGDLYGVGQHVLAVGCPVLQGAEEADQVVVHAAGDLGVVEGLAACALHLLLHVLLGLGHYLLDAPGVDAPVLHEASHGDPGHLAADRIEAGDHHGLRRVVDYHVHPGRGLEGPYVPALAAYDAALHVVGGQRDGLDRGLGGQIRGQALHGRGDQAPRLDVGPLLGLQGLVADHLPEPALQLGFEVGEEPPLGLRPRKAGYLLQDLEVFGLLLLELLALAGQVILGLREPATALVQLALATLQGCIPVVQAFFHAGDLGPPGTHLRLGVVLDLQRGLLGRQIGLAAFGLGLALGILDDGGRVGAGLRLATVHPRPVNKVSQDGADGYAEDQSQDQQQNTHRLSFQRTRREYGGPASS